MDSNKGTKNKGLWQWVRWYSNWCKGCYNGCLYCYAMLREVCRFKRMNYEDWQKFELKTPIITNREGKNTTKITKREGWGMLPATHDIFPEILDASIEYFRKHLEIGNKLLIVSKGNFDCIKAIIKEFRDYKAQILLRFTITTKDEELLEFWEPNASRYRERIDSLMYANNKGFKTSVSIEPFLDRDPIPLIKSVEPFVSEVIWLGSMNHLKNIAKIVSSHSSEFQYIKEITSTKHLISIVRDIENTELLSKRAKKKIQYKDSFDKVLELEHYQKLDKWIEV